MDGVRRLLLICSWPRTCSRRRYRRAPPKHSQRILWAARNGVTPHPGCLIEDMAEETAEWMKAWGGTGDPLDARHVRGRQVSVLLLAIPGHPEPHRRPDPQLLHMTPALRPGPAWKKRTDDGYRHLASMESLPQVNGDYVRQKTAPHRMASTPRHCSMSFLGLRGCSKHNDGIMGFKIRKSYTLKHACLHCLKKTGGGGSSYILNTPLIWQFRFHHIPEHAPPIRRFRIIIYLKHAPSVGDTVSSYILNCPLIWRFRFNMYHKHAPAFGDSGSSYISNTPTHLAIPFHHTS